jgi:hypothetical protein
MNTINYLADNSDLNIQVYTSLKEDSKQFSHNQVILNRFAFTNKSDKKLTSLYKQLVFNFGIFFKLLLFRPTHILYYETYAALPVFLFKMLISNKVKVFIHFHEYFSPYWYSKTMKLVAFSHYIERKFLFRKAIWISQTNESRVKLFTEDHPELKNKSIKILPNFPPKSWLKHNLLKNISDPIRLVYVGALQLKSSYISEVCEWVLKFNGKVTLDIYTYSEDLQTSTYLKSLPEKSIRVFDNGIYYFDIPDTISSYDIGLILYKVGHVDPNRRLYNTLYCAPNKLFEYQICGLDVWFPSEMKGIKPYITKNAYPKVNEFNFKNLECLDIYSIISRHGLTYKEPTLFAEDVNAILLEALNK